jgi:hypothetical protein
MHEAMIEEDLRGFLARDAALVERLRSRNVDLVVDREIDLHFFAKSPDAGRKLVDALRTIWGGIDNIGPADWETGQVSVTYTVHQSVLYVTTPATVERRIRLAAGLGVIHDGWGTRL